MSNPPELLNPDGSASLATAFMTSHFAFRRDLGRFSVALAEPAVGSSRAQALREEWLSFHTHLRGHHEAEDTGVFPALSAQHGRLAAIISQLGADHRLIDTLLARGDRAFAALATSPADAVTVVQELRGLLDAHLAIEEAELVPFLREMKDFPAPPDDASLELYAEGFAWSMQGVAPEVVAQIYAMLPQSLRSKLPAAQAVYEARCEQLWGTLPPSAARTPIP